MPAPPLILTLTIDEPAQHYFTGLRNQYFPKHCNWLQAHLTLFHRLPTGNDFIDETIKAFCKRAAMPLTVTGIRNIGNGVAFTIASSALLEMHASMQQAFWPLLIRRDRETLWPHITVQNKVTAFKAMQTAAALSDGFKPFTVTGFGISSWHYMGGPWEPQATYLFTG